MPALLVLAVGSAYLWFSLKWSDRYYRWISKGIFKPRPWQLGITRWGGVVVSSVFVVAGLAELIHPAS